MPLSSQFEKMLEEEAKRKRVPLTVKLELLPVCNMNCKMCYVRTDMSYVNQHGGLIPAEKWIALARELRKAGTLFLLLTGGEVFLYPDFRKLYEELVSMGFMITINTNATMIDDEAAQWLSQTPPNLVSISLYGASDETYEQLCGQKGMFTKVDRAIRLLRDKGIRMELKSILNPMNVMDAEAMAEYAEKLGIYYLADSYAYPPIRKAEKEEAYRFSPEETARQKILFNRRANDDQGFVLNALKILKSYEDAKDVPGEDLYGFTCGAANFSGWVNWQGRLTPCVMLQEPYTLPFDIGFLSAWEELKKKCDQILMSTKCSRCDKRSVCTVCPAANFAETGSFQEASPFHCKMTACFLEEIQSMVAGWGIDLAELKEKEKQ